jgi:hypothetical protein
MKLLPWSEFARIEPLFAGSGNAEGLPGWYATLIETTLAAGEMPVCAVAESGQTVTAAIPLVVTARGLRALTAPYTTRFVPFLPDVSSAHKIGSGLRAVASGRVWLDGLDAADACHQALAAGLGRTMVTATYQGFANWTAPVDDFAAYWQSRPARLRSTVKRKAAAAKARFHYLNGNFEAALRDYEAIRAASWKAAEPHPAFLAALVQNLAPVVRMGLLEIGDRPVAAQIWLVHGGRATIFKLVHRDDTAALSPGTLLTNRMIEACLQREAVRVLDFGRGDDAYKRDWMTARSTRLGVIAADWRRAQGLRSIATEILPTVAGCAWRRQFGHKSDGSATADDAEMLAPSNRQGTVSSEALP